EIDEGTLILTSARLVFLGRLKTVEAPLDQLVSIQAEDGASVIIRGRGDDAPMAFVLSEAGRAQYLVRLIDIVRSGTAKVA
ncbi:hypothetical protein, partial [Pantoea sp. GbtcB22]|uniref:hypothetical protein n=1 Tax=Pantoea sp. GbtcB22 TaxID=2824767 RepID=UPI001C2FE42B